MGGRRPESNCPRGCVPCRGNDSSRPRSRLRLAWSCTGYPSRAWLQRTLSAKAFRCNAINRLLPENNLKRELFALAISPGLTCRIMATARGVYSCFGKNRWRAESGELVAADVTDNPLRAEARSAARARRRGGDGAGGGPTRITHSFRGSTIGYRMSLGCR
ncbi:hypothetical protein EVAR_85422_1 [Eumeta japonica]|uniref:Uncharacterized protein n=1 Tax=Eumeta variegata TaxID=151549 RepID=A0A4C1WJ04_EUMVA|nr:hypothetical protein EVAR_85422_1 [Eumeta japonica]